MQLSPSSTRQALKPLTLTNSKNLGNSSIRIKKLVRNHSEENKSGRSQGGAFSNKSHSTERELRSPPVLVCVNLKSQTLLPSKKETRPPSKDRMTSTEDLQPSMQVSKLKSRGFSNPILGFDLRLGRSTENDENKAKLYRQLSAQPSARKENNPSSLERAQEKPVQIEDNDCSQKRESVEGRVGKSYEQSGLKRLIESIHKLPHSETIKKIESNPAIQQKTKGAIPRVFGLDSHGSSAIILQKSALFDTIRGRTVLKPTTSLVKIAKPTQDEILIKLKNNVTRHNIVTWECNPHYSEKSLIKRDRNVHRQAEPIFNVISRNQIPRVDVITGRVIK